MFMVPINTASRRPDGRLVGVSSPIDDPTRNGPPFGWPVVSASAPPHPRTGCSRAGALPLGPTRCATGIPTGIPVVATSTCHRTLGRGAPGRQGVALDPSRSLRAPSRTMVKGAVGLPFKTHDRGYFALPWTPSPNPARVEIRVNGCPSNHHQGPALDSGQ